MMEAARTSETLVNFYQTARRYNPEDSHLRTHRRENLKSYFNNKHVGVLLFERKCINIVLIYLLINLSISAFFNDGLNSLDYIVSNGSMIKKN
jgi:hypothetical protein